MTPVILNDWSQVCLPPTKSLLYQLLALCLKSEYCPYASVAIYEGRKLNLLSSICGRNLWLRSSLYAYSFTEEQFVLCYAAY